MAMSTAVSTEMPTSADFMAAASLMPSPRYPTLWPFSRRTRTTRAFCSGESFANTLTVSASSPQLPVVELLQIGAQEDPVHVQPHLLADGAGDLLIVTGQDLYLDAILHQRLDRRFCGLLGRVQKCQESNQHHIRLISHGELPHRGGVGLLGHGDNPHPILVQLIRLVQNKPAHLVRQRSDLAAALGPGAAPEHLLHPRPW